VSLHSEPINRFYEAALEIAFVLLAFSVLLLLKDDCETIIDFAKSTFSEFERNSLARGVEVAPKSLSLVGPGVELDKALALGIKADAVDALLLNFLWELEVWFFLKIVEFAFDEVLLVDAVELVLI